MRRSAIPFRSTTVYAKYPESEEEERALEKLARETRVIWARGARTSFQIVADFRLNGRYVLVAHVLLTEVDKPLELNSKEIAWLENELQAHFYQEAS